MSALALGHRAYISGNALLPELQLLHVRYSFNVTSHLLKIFVESRASVEQTYFSTLTAYRSRKRSHNIKLRHSIQFYGQILSSSVISSLQSFISCPYLILDIAHKMKLKAIILEGKSDISNLERFSCLAHNVNSRSCDFNKGEHNAGHD